MSKKIDWGQNYKQPMRGKVVANRNASYTTRREQVAQAVGQLKKAEEESERFRVLEPHLRKSLMEHMLSRTPIIVQKPMAYFTEELSKASEDPVDQAYYRQPQAQSNATYQVVRKPLPVGTELVFDRIDSQLGQWIFKSTLGHEVEIYDQPMITLDKDTVVQNPGFWGLLCATNIYDETLASLVPGDDSDE